MPVWQYLTIAVYAYAQKVQWTFWGRSCAKPWTNKKGYATIKKSILFSYLHSFLSFQSGRQSSETAQEISMLSLYNKSREMTPEPMEAVCDE